LALSFGVRRRPPDPRQKSGQLALFDFTFGRAFIYYPTVTAEMFRPELAEAMKAYDKYVVCIDKTPEDFEKSLLSLLTKAIKAFESRGPTLRHGIALDRQVTVILSQNDGSRPLCGIYFNLHSPYQRQTPLQTAQPLSEPIGGGQP